jgi:hypothetical protein
MAETLESEIQKSLDAIMRVRRQVTVLNERERNAYLTARDLYRRLLMSGASELAHDAEVMGESQELVEQLRQVEAAVARLEDAFRGAGTQPPVSSMAEDILASEAEAIREAYARAAENSTTVDETTTGEEH